MIKHIIDLEINSGTRWGDLRKFVAFGVEFEDEDQVFVRRDADGRVVAIQCDRDEV